ncbi:hypothetical protein CPB85DRAFT_400229 [Mucidula mucida]|nr:hypothetical protein CPB85DRAFT_400229 [Mucidula mucida]
MQWGTDFASSDTHTENVSGTSSNQLRVDTNKPSSFYQHLTMFFTRIATTVALAVALASAAPAPDLQKRQPNAFFCTDADFTGNCFLSTTAGCINVGAGFQDDVTSFGPDPGVFCNLFTNFDCTGSHITLTNPGSGHLEQLNFNDVMSSFQCFFQ